MAVFTRDVVVRFAHTDVAGIVFYPRYFEMMNDLVEDWFASALGRSFKEIYASEKDGVPLLQVEASFPKPSRLGDVLGFALRVERLGKSAFTLAITAHCDGEERVSSRQVIVWIARGDPVRAAPIPDDVRARIAPFVVDGG